MHAFLILVPLLTLTGCTGKAGSDSATTDSTADTDTNTDTGTDTDTNSDTGTAPDCTTLCATYGGAVPTAAGQIVDTAAADPEFQPFFANLVSQGNDAVNAFKASLAAFISDAYGCSSGTYTGPDMKTAHHGMAITQAEYDDFISLIAGVLSGDGVPDAYISTCFAPALVDPAFSSTIVGQ